MLCPGAGPGGLQAQDTPACDSHVPPWQPCRPPTAEMQAAPGNVVGGGFSLCWVVGVGLREGTEEELPRALSQGEDFWATTPLDLLFPPSLLDPKDGPVLYPQNLRGMPLLMPPLWGPAPDA